MNCQKVQARLSSYQDGELPATWRERMAAHLEGCPACRGEWQALQRLEKELRALPEIEPRTGFTAAVMARLPDASTAIPAAKKVRLVPSLVYSLAFLLVFALGLLLAPPQNGGSGLPATPQRGESLASVLMESQSLQLLNVQDQTVSLLEANAHE